MTSVTIPSEKEFRSIWFEKKVLNSHFLSLYSQHDFLLSSTHLMCVWKCERYFHKCFVKSGLNLVYRFTNCLQFDLYIRSFIHYLIALRSRKSFCPTRLFILFCILLGRESWSLTSSGMRSVKTTCCRGCERRVTKVHTPSFSKLVSLEWERSKRRL